MRHTGKNVLNSLQCSITIQLKQQRYSEYKEEMSKNSNKAKRASNSSRRNNHGDQVGGNRREIQYREEGQEYGKIIKAFGDGRFQVICGDNRLRMGKVRGTLRKKVYCKPVSCLPTATFMSHHIINIYDLCDSVRMMSF